MDKVKTDKRPLDPYVKPKAFLIGYALLFLAAPAAMIIPGLSVIFSQGLFSKTIYGDMTVLWALYGFALWCKNSRTDKPKPNYKEILTRFRDYLGYKRETVAKDIILGVAAGMILLSLTVGFQGLILHQKIQLNPLGPLILLLYAPALLLQSLIMPVFEELIYRGIYLRLTAQLFQKTPLFLITSSIMFAYIHPELPAIKLITAFGLGLIYILPKERRMLTPMAAHITANAALMMVLIG